MENPIEAVYYTLKTRVSRNIASAHCHNKIILISQVATTMSVEVMAGTGHPDGWCHVIQHGLPFLVVPCWLIMKKKSSQNFGYIKRASHPHLCIHLREKQFNFLWERKKRAWVILRAWNYKALVSLVSERLGVLRFWEVSQNITILIILISLVKYFPFVFARGRRLKAEPRNFLVSSFMLVLYYIPISF